MKRKYCPANHPSLYNAVAKNSSGRLHHIGERGFLINPAGVEEHLEEEYLDCGDHQLIVQLVVMGFVF